MTVQFRAASPIDIQNNVGQYGAIQNANLVSSGQNPAFAATSQGTAPSAPAPSHCGGSLDAKA